MYCWIQIESNGKKRNNAETMLKQGCSRNSGGRRKREYSEEKLETLYDWLNAISV